MRKLDLTTKPQISVIQSYQLSNTYEHLISISDDDAATLYEYLSYCWKERASFENAEQIRHVLEQYRKGHDEAIRLEPARRIARLMDAARETGQSFSILELGCANGPLVRSLEILGVGDDLKFVGVEPFRPFADDLRKDFPQHSVIDGDASSFVDFDFADDTPFDIFYESVTFCMLPPPVVRACLKKAATVCKTIVILDYIANGLTPVNVDGNLVFGFYPQNGQYYFAHNYPQYFSELGWRIADAKMVTHPDGNSGYGVLVASA